MWSWLPSALLALCLLFPALACGADQRTFEYDERHQLLHVRHPGSPALNVAFDYDANGNRTRKTQGGVTFQYRWDGQNRLVEVLQDGTWLARYDYDTDGQRIQKLVNATPSPRLVRYVWEYGHVIRETNAVGNTIARYEWHGDRLLSSWRDGTWHYFQHDALGSIVRESAEDGGLFARHGYDAWGNPTRTFGSASNPHLFTGYPVDDETGLHYANARYYDSGLGAFLSVDPAAGEPTEPVTFHPFVYARGNPLIYVDPDGRTAEIQHVLTGFERNRQGLVRHAEGLKLLRGKVGWLGERALDLSLASTALLNVGNYVGEGVTATANAGANLVLSVTHEYVVDVGRGADAANAEMRELYVAAATAAVKLSESPGEAIEQGADAVAKPFIDAYAGDTRAQFEVLASLDPRSFSKRVLGAIGRPSSGEPAGIATVTESADGRARLPGSDVSNSALSTSDPGRPINDFAFLNKAGMFYPEVTDLRTGRQITFPTGELTRVPKADRAPWGAAERGTFIKEWYDRGYQTPSGGWEQYDIHHVRPREFGGSNEFWNLAPVQRATHQKEFNAYWSGM